VELGNVCCSDLGQLHRTLIQAKERLRHKKEIIKNCSRKSWLLDLVSLREASNVFPDGRLSAMQGDTD
jgi:hypothetical protein